VYGAQNDLKLKVFGCRHGSGAVDVGLVQARSVRTWSMPIVSNADRDTSTGRALSCAPSTAGQPLESCGPRWFEFGTRIVPHFGVYTNGNNGKHQKCGTIRVPLPLHGTLGFSAEARAKMHI